MKVTVVFKCPDAVDAAAEDIEDDAERSAFRRLCRRFFEYGEYARIVVDTEAGTATVKEVG